MTRNMYLVNEKGEALNILEDKAEFVKDIEMAKMMTYKEALNYKNEHKEMDLHIKERQ